MKILFYDLDNFEKNYFLDKFSKNIEPYYFQFSLNEKTVIIPKYSDAEAICTTDKFELSEDLLKKFKNLSYIFLRTDKYDFLNTEYCKKNNIEVYNTPLLLKSTVSEYVFALIFSLLRKLPQARESIFNADITKEELMGFELKNKTIGIIGKETILENMEKYSKCFDFNLYVYDPNDSNTDSNNLEILLKTSDIIIIDYKSEESNSYLIDYNNISYMKKEAFLINISSGEFVDLKALYNALKTKKIKGAGLDCVECREELCSLYKKCSSKKYLREKCIKKFLFVKKLNKLENVIITPKNSINTIETRKNILDMTIININSVLNNINSGTKISF